MAHERTSSTQRGYTYRWQKARETYLSRPENVLCRKCKAKGLITVATVVDHITPHKGDSKLFWNTQNWQPLCKPCHDGEKQAEDRGTQTQTFDATGRVDW